MEWFSKNKAALVGAALAVLSVVVHFLAVDQTRHPTGWDGYYYVMQVHSWTTYGHLQSPDFSLIYPYFAFLSIVAGDTILGFKIGVALLGGLLVASVYFSLIKRGVSLSWACVVSAYLCFSPVMTYFLLQFPKNALGLIFLVLCFSSKNRIVIVLTFIATILSHRMTGGFVVIGGALYALRNIQWKWIVAGLAVVLTVSFLPGILHFSDLERFSNQFVLIPQWAPFSFYTIFPNTLVWYFKAELVFISFLILISLFLLIRNRKEVPFTSWIWLMVALISIFPFFKFSPGDAGHRFFLIAPLAFIMIIPFRDLKPSLQWVAAAGFIIVSFFSFHAYKPQHFDPPNSLYSYIASRLEKRYDPRDYPLVIAHSSLAEMIIFKTDFDALNWLPPEDMQPQHVLRLINGVNYPDLRKYLDTRDRTQLRPVSGGYIALPEDAWQRFVVAASKDNDPRIMGSIFGGTNPMDKRPYYLSKGKIR